MSSKKQYFLAKNGSVLGPIEPDQIDTLRTSGQISNYTWICKNGDSQWTPLDPPPALPTLTNAEIPAVAPPPFRHAPQAQAPQREPAPIFRSAPVKTVNPEAYRVILFDHENAVSGWLTSAFDGGCEIRSDQNGSDPLFVQKSAACLSLHDTKTGEAIKINVRLGAVQRSDGGWSYRLRWKNIPALEELLQVS
jgi:hypothetical protein